MLGTHRADRAGHHETALNGRLLVEDRWPRPKPEAAGVAFVLQEG